MSTFRLEKVFGVKQYDTFVSVQWQKSTITRQTVDRGEATDPPPTPNLSCPLALTAFSGRTTVGGLRNQQ